MLYVGPVAATPSVKVVKTMPYRGGVKTWSNRHHFNGGTPANTTAWDTFFDAVVAAEKLIYESDVTITECVGYAAGSDVPVASKSYTTVGTWAGDGNAKRPPGAVCGLLRWSTTARSSKNHPIYLYTYLHAQDADYAGANEQDAWFPAQKSLATTYGNAWISGFSDGSHTLVRAGPNGATAVGVTAETYLTHRDFPS